MKNMHQGICGGNFAAKEMNHKILSFGYFWPTIFSDVQKFIRIGMSYQKFSRKQKIPTFPLRLV